jgi:hypothetical protein
MMRHGDLFVPPNVFSTRIRELKERGLQASLARLLLQVELGFALMEALNLEDEPVTAVWAILSGMPLRHPRLQTLTESQRRAIANARQIIPHSARFAWISAVCSYVGDIPVEFRNYDLREDHLFKLEECIIHAHKHLQHYIHQDLYDRCLNSQLEFSLRSYAQVEAGIRYQFEARTQQEVFIVPISFQQEQYTESEIVKNSKKS